MKGGPNSTGSIPESVERHPCDVEAESEVTVHTFVASSAIINRGT